MSVYYLADGLGSTMATTDASGNIVNTYTYDPYGATTSSTGSQPSAFQFTGQATDATGLQYLRARYYDPSTGTFISSDPMGVSPTWPGQPYGYGGDNPVLNADPLGLVCFLSVCADRDGVSVGGHEAANGATAVGTVAVGTALTAGRIAQGCVLDVPMCWSATEDALVATATFDLGFVAIGSTCAAGLLTGPGAIAFCALGIGTVAVPFFAAGGTLGVIAGKEFWDLGEKQS